MPGLREEILPCPSATFSSFSVRTMRQSLQALSGSKLLVAAACRYSDRFIFTYNSAFTYLGYFKYHVPPDPSSSTDWCSPSVHYSPDMSARQPRGDLPNGHGNISSHVFSFPSMTRDGRDKAKLFQVPVMYVFRGGPQLVKHTVRERCQEMSPYCTHHSGLLDKTT